MVKKVVLSPYPRLASPCDDWKTLSVNSAVNGYLFSESGKDKAMPFISCAQGTVGLSPPLPLFIMVWETATITFWMKCLALSTMWIKVLLWMTFSAPNTMWI